MQKSQAKLEAPISSVLFIHSTKKCVYELNFDVQQFEQN